ncbi:hypothetical protein HNR16_001706 [Pseudoclavibacter chungangensis]|nr:hypothetical protein [Pseudoclavibacter chungangensis]
MDVASTSGRASPRPRATQPSSHCASDGRSGSTHRSRRPDSFVRPGRVAGSLHGHRGRAGDPALLLPTHPSHRRSASHRPPDRTDPGPVRRRATHRGGSDLGQLPAHDRRLPPPGPHTREDRDAGRHRRPPHGYPEGLDELPRLGRTLRQRASDVLAFFDLQGTSNGPTEAICESGFGWSGTGWSGWMSVVSAGVWLSKQLARSRCLSVELSAPVGAVDAVRPTSVTSSGDCPTLRVVAHHRFAPE